MLKQILKCFKKSQTPLEEEQPLCEPNLILKKLPADELGLIFDHLALRDLINCRRVCMAFRSMVDSRTFRELLVSAEFWEQFEESSWFQVGRPVHLGHSIRLGSKLFSIDLASQGLQKLGSNLRFLSIKCRVWNLEFLNLFVELEELRILRAGRLPRYKTTLRLPNLNKFACSLISCDYWNTGYTPRLLLDTPLLQSVRLERNLHWFQFSFGETVKHLQIERCDLTFELLERFVQLKNLERFSCTDPRFLKGFDVLKYRPNLKRIDCYRHPCGEQFDLIEKLLEQKSSRALDVQIYYESQLVNNTSDLKRIQTATARRGFGE